MSRVRVGIVGLGHNGLAHLQTHLASIKSEVVALCDRRANVLKEAGKAFGIRRLYSSDEIYSDPDVQAISIHTGDPQHRIPFIRALAAGKHVLIEKPLANTEEDVLDMVSAADMAAPDLKIQVGYILRFSPVFAALHRLTRQGVLGNIYYMEADYIHNLLYQASNTDPATGKNWYLEEELPMVGGGSHPLDLLRWISGKEVVSVWAYSNHFAFPAMRNDDCQVALFRFEDGSIAKVAALYGPRCEYAPCNNIRLYGTKGTADQDRVAISRSDDDVHPALEPISAEKVQGHPYGPEVEDWLGAILEDRPTRTGLHDGANSTVATLCAVRAARERREVMVPVLRAAKKDPSGE